MLKDHEDYNPVEGPMRAALSSRTRRHCRHPRLCSRCTDTHDQIRSTTFRCASTSASM